MSSLHPLLFVAGFFAATFTVTRVLHWISLVHSSIVKLGGDFLGAPKRRLIWAAPFVVLLHPVPYFILGLLTFSVLTIAGRLSPGWRWFMAGFYAYVLLSGLLVLNVMHRRRSQRNRERKIVGPSQR